MNRWVPLHSHLHGLFASWRLADGRPGPEAPIVGQGMPRDPHDTVNRAWMLAGVCSDKWAGHPTHAIRKRYISHLVEAGITDAAIDHAVGHSPRGVRARHYVDPLAFFRLLREALHTIPAGDTKAA